MEIINILKSFEIQTFILLGAMIIHLTIFLSQVMKKKKRISFLLISCLFLVIIFLLSLFNLFKAQVKVTKTYPSWQSTYSYDKPIEIEFNLPVNLNSLIFNSFPNNGGKIIKKTYLPFIPYGRKIEYMPDVSYEPDQRVMIYLSNIKKPFSDAFGSEYLLEFFAEPLPQITKSTPNDNDINVAQNSQITFNLTSANNRYSDWNFDISPQQSYTVAFPSDTEIKLNFTSPLQSNTTYQITSYQNSVKYNLSTSQVVSRGERLPVYNFKFTTAKSPFISLFSPSGENVLPNKPVVIYFDDVMNKSSVETNFKISPDVSGVFSWEDGKILSFTPQNMLNKNTLYTVSLLKNISTEKGGILDRDTNYIFKTVGEVSVASTNPANENNNINLNHSISIEFNQEVSYESAQSHFTIEPNVDGGFSWDENKLIFTPFSELEYGTKYIVTLKNGINSFYGLPSSKDYTFTFTTASKQHVLDVPYFKQEESFTCNIAAMRMLLSYRGIVISEKELKDAVGQNGARGNGNPYLGYVDQYGTYWDPISKVITNYRQNKVFTDWNITSLLTEIENGNPVMVWGQNGWSDPHELSWTTADGTYIYAINGMHSYVVTGFTGEKDNPTSILVNDPWRGVRELPPDEFTKLWSYFNTALVIY